jgi:hypothetical protein
MFSPTLRKVRGQSVNTTNEQSGPGGLGFAHILILNEFKLATLPSYRPSSLYIPPSAIPSFLIDSVSLARMYAVMTTGSVISSCSIVPSLFCEYPCQPHLLLGRKTRSCETHLTSDPQLAIRPNLILHLLILVPLPQSTLPLLFLPFEFRSLDGPLIIHLVRLWRKRIAERSSLRFPYLLLLQSVGLDELVSIQLVVQFAFFVSATPRFALLHRPLEHCEVFRLSVLRRNDPGPKARLTLGHLLPRTFQQTEPLASTGRITFILQLQNIGQGVRSRPAC